MNLLLLLLAFPPQDGPASRVDTLLAQIRSSGVVFEIARGERLADSRREVAPGAPPLLAFRYFQGADRHRFSKLDLMLDDAGH